MQLKLLLPEGPRYFPEDHLTDQPERFLVAELIREKIFHLLREEVPYAVAVTVEKFAERPEQNRIDIEATIHVERDSQKGIIIGKKGQMLKEIGKQARGDIEALLGSSCVSGVVRAGAEELAQGPACPRGVRLPPGAVKLCSTFSHHPFPLSWSQTQEGQHSRTGDGVRPESEHGWKESGRQ